MRLRSKLTVTAAGLTFAIVLVLSGVFLAELLRERIAETAANDEVMAQQVRTMAAQAVQAGLTAAPPADSSAEAFAGAVRVALAGHAPLTDTMSSLVRYSPNVEDVSVADAGGKVLVSTDPALVGQAAPVRASFDAVRYARVWVQVRDVFGKGRVLDVTARVDRNGQRFLVVHLGVRSTFLKASYEPFLRYAAWLVVLAAAVTVLAAGALASLALRPIEEISRRLEGMGSGEPSAAGDAVVRASESIERLGRQMRTTEAGYTDLQANLDRMLDTLREGVVLFTAERRAVMVSDAVAKFLPENARAEAGQELAELFAGSTALGRAVLAGFATGGVRLVRLEDGREIELSLDRINHGEGAELGTLLTLRDTGSAETLERELEVSRRLAAVGRLTAGVGHEVKNPINAMVVHLELLRGKLEAAGEGREFFGGAMRHVEVLAGEMSRLDRVVTALANFTRPVELRLAELDLRSVVESVMELTAEEMRGQGVAARVTAESVTVRADGELLRQALLNLVLNAMQAMPTGGDLRIGVRREQEDAIVEIEDDGSGIAAELLPRIFELYFTTKANGSGIGLAMTYRIAQMHGGAVEAASEPGEGARFTLRLPAMLESRRAA